jgi:hypothetical protein
MGLERVREAARRNGRLRFTALLHHTTPQLLVETKDSIALRSVLAFNKDVLYYVKKP